MPSWPSKANTPAAPLHLLQGPARSDALKRLQVKPQQTTSERKAQLKAKKIFSFASAPKTLAKKAAVSAEKASAIRAATGAGSANADRIRNTYQAYNPHKAQ